MDPSERRTLEKRAMRAYELGRLRVAARVAIVVFPIVMLAAIISGQPAECACLGALLLLGAVGMRWYGKGWDRVVVPGIVAGTIPMLAGLLKNQFPSANGEIACAVLCTVGFASGAFLGRSVFERAGQGGRGWIAGVGVASATALLGCLGGGFEAPLGLGIGALFVALYYSLRSTKTSAQ